MRHHLEVVYGLGHRLGFLSLVYLIGYFVNSCLLLCLFNYFLKRMYDHKPFEFLNYFQLKQIFVFLTKAFEIMDLQTQILLQNFRIHLQKFFHCFQLFIFINFLNLLSKKILHLLRQNFLFLNLNYFSCRYFSLKNDFYLPSNIICQEINLYKSIINFNLMAMIQIKQKFILPLLKY